MCGETGSLIYCSVQFSSVTQSCPTLCDPMNRSTLGPPVHHQLLEFTQTHVHWVGDAIQPSHTLSSPSPPAPNASQHQSLSNESTLHMSWPKYWSFSFSIIPSKERQDVKLCCHFGKFFGSFLKGNIQMLTIQPSNWTTCHLPQKNENMSTHRHEHSYSKQFICSI